MVALRLIPPVLHLCILLLFLFGSAPATSTLGTCDASLQAQYKKREHVLIRHAQEYLERIRDSESTFRRNGTILPVGSFSSFGETGLDDVNKERRIAVKNAVKHAWDAYVGLAWGFDELKPVTRQGTNSFAAGLGTTIVDSLSTLYLMGGLDGRYKRARNWVASELNFEKIGSVIVFETVIRVLGGLISMYHLSGDEMYMRKAEELGVRLSGSFDSPSGLPWPRCFLNETGRFETHTSIGDALYLAEIGTVQLEYRALAHHSKEPLLKRVRAVTEETIEKLQVIGSHSVRLGGKFRALLPFSLSLSSGMYSTNMVTLGAPADSYFEYLVKSWVQGGGTESRYWELFAQVIDGIVELASYTSRFGDTIVRDVVPDQYGRAQFSHRMDHFSCYIPGMIVLGLRGLGVNETERRNNWEQLAESLTDTCYLMYKRSPSGLSGENIRLGDEDQWRMSGAYNLRPEAVEAFFYMWRHTKKEKYRKYAWDVFQQIEKHCKIDEGGYAVIKNARSRKPRKQDIMHSFVIAETFKYLYLIFGPDEELPLNKWVFNTEAHPLLITPDLNADEGVISVASQVSSSTEPSDSEQLKVETGVSTEHTEL